MSTTAQVEGVGLRRQYDDAVLYATEHGLTLVADPTFSDKGVSAFDGSNAKKGGLGRFIEAARNGDIPRGSFLLVESHDRLSRGDVMAAFLQFAELLELGITIVTLCDSQVCRPGRTEPGDIFVILGSMMRANEDSKMKSLRGKSNWSKKRLSSGPQTSLCPSWLRLDASKTFVFVPEAADIVRRIYTLAIEGNGKFAIAGILNREGVKPPRGKIWRTSSVGTILTNRAVLGEHQPHRMVAGKRVPEGDPIPDYFPALIDDDLFLRVQAGLKLRRRGGGRRGKTFANLFTGLATCAYCGESLHYENKGSGPKGGQYLRCSNAKGARGCTASAVKYAVFEYSVLSIAGELDLGAVLDASERKSHRQTVRDAIDAVGQKISGLEVARDRIMRLMQDVDVGDDYLINQYASNRDQIAALQEESSRLQSELAAAPRHDQQEAENLRLLLERFYALDGEDAYRHRPHLHQRLRQLLVGLRVAANGLPAEDDDALLWEFARQIADPHERAEFVRSYRKGFLGEGEGKEGASFVIGFVDGTIRAGCLGQTVPASEWRNIPDSFSHLRVDGSFRSSRSDPVKGAEDLERLRNPITEPPKELWCMGKFIAWPPWIDTPPTK